LKKWRPVLELAGAEIPGFDLPNLFSGLATSLSPVVLFVAWVLINFNNIDLITRVLPRIKLRWATC
jgi:hypothetical protein